MPRTRDYTLILTTITMLVVAIVGVLHFGFGVQFSQRAAVFVATSENMEFSASVATNDNPSRSERLQRLRDKISDLGNSIVAAATIEPDNPIVATSSLASTPVEDAPVENKGEERCSGYYATGESWDPRGLLIEEVEGGRLVYRQSSSVQSASSSDPLPSKEIVLQLPVRSTPLSGHRCIGTDVIGIAKDGSLIRNNEASVYRIFGQETLVGYALDGFPIYGNSSTAGDVCGGSMVAGQYRYQISSARDTIINCYAGAPVSI